MALKAHKKKPGKKTWRDRGPVDRITIIMRMIAGAGLFLFIGSIIWAGVYRFAEPPGTLLMLERKRSEEHTSELQSH